MKKVILVLQILLIFLTFHYYSLSYFTLVPIKINDFGYYKSQNFYYKFIFIMLLAIGIIFNIYKPIISYFYKKRIFTSIIISFFIYNLIFLLFYLYIDQLKPTLKIAYCSEFMTSLYGSEYYPSKKLCY